MARLDGGDMKTIQLGTNDAAIIIKGREAEHLGWDFVPSEYTFLNCTICKGSTLGDRMDAASMIAAALVMALNDSELCARILDHFKDNHELFAEEQLRDAGADN